MGMQPTNARIIIVTFFLDSCHKPTDSRGNPVSVGFSDFREENLESLKCAYERNVT